MRNIKNEILKKCIFISFEDFKSLVEKVTDGLLTAGYDLEGIWYEATNKAEAEGVYWQEDIEETLSKYYDIEITSIHADDCDDIKVWICYQDK